MTSRLAAPAPPRSPWQLFYGGAHRLRGLWYRQRAVRLPRPVISVGNLHWGGGGKTPLVAALAARLCERGLRVAILSRGYRSRGKGIRLVSDGAGPLLGPTTAGDEPVLLAGQLPGVAVLVGPDRASVGRHALARLDPAPDLFLLDDGFSHLRLARDLDILCFPMSDPYAGGRLPPGGRLREPLASSRRADAAILTGRGVTPEDGQRLGRELAAHGFGGAAFAAPTELVLEERVEGPALLVSGIARPEVFEEGAQQLRVEVAGHLRFPDHYPFPDDALERIRGEMERVGARRIVTTGKDRVKLLGRLELPIVELRLRARPEKGFVDWLERRVDELVPR